MDSEHSAKTTDSDTCTETHISGWAVTGDIQVAWLGWSSASAPLLPLDLDSAPSSCSQCGHKGGRHWGSMCRGTLFLHMACNELSQPLMASLTEATRQNGSPSWQSDPAGCSVVHESLIRVWPGQCSCCGPSAPGQCVSRAPPQTHHGFWKQESPGDAWICPLTPGPTSLTSGCLFFGAQCARSGLCSGSLIMAVQRSLVLPSGSVPFSSVAQSCLALQPHESQHARPPCPSPTPGVYSNSRPSSR